MIDKVEKFLRRMRWKAHFFESYNAENSQVKTSNFGFKSRGGGSIFKLKGPRCGFKLSLVSRLGLMGQKILKISYSRTPENGPICQILLCS